MTLMTPPPDLREAASTDLEELSQLEARAGDVHWSRAQLGQELSGTHSRLRVLRLDGRLCGYGGYWKVADEAQISNLVIAPEHRRRGYGRQMLLAFLKEAAREGCRRAILEVRAGNAAAQALYASCGFQETGRRCDFYKDPLDDAVLMEKPL